MYNLLTMLIHGNKRKIIIELMHCLFGIYNAWFLKSFLCRTTYECMSVCVSTLEYVCTVPLDLNFTLASTYSRALTPFRRAVS